MYKRQAIDRAKKDSKLSDEELSMKVSEIRVRGPKTDEDWSLLREYRDRIARRDNKRNRQKRK